MLLFLLLGHTPTVLLVCLIALVYLAWFDLRAEPLHPQIKIWWYVVVLLTNVLGYAALRIWLALRRRRAGAHRPA